MAGERNGDRVAAWLLYVLQLAGESLLAPFWLMSVMMTDSCGSVSEAPAVCDGNYFFTWFIAYAVVLGAAAVATPLAILVAGKRGARRWPWPAGIILLLAAATAGYVFVMTR